jgi:hypothetical protein
MAEDREDGLTARPGDDPYELEWPDDSKELRAAEREQAAQRALVRPAPVVLTQLVIGIGVVFAFLLPVAIVTGAPAVLLYLAAPVAVAGLVLAFPAAWLLERVSRTWRKGLADLAFIVLGLAVGYGWTFVLLTLFQDQAFPDEVDISLIRSWMAIFMGTAVASSFAVTHAATGWFRMRPKAVYGGALVIGLLIILSAIANLLG